MKAIEPAAKEILAAQWHSGVTVASQADQPLHPPAHHFTWVVGSTDCTLEQVAQLEHPSPNLIELGEPSHCEVPHTLKSVRVAHESPRHNGGSVSPGPGSGNNMPRDPRDSPEASSTASDSPTPTNSVQEKNWTATHWQGLVSGEERCQLLGTEEESSDRHSSGSESDRDHEGDSIWTITPEQRDYYCAQFRSLQPDLSGLLEGTQARRFFEKSRLPLLELRKIWQLADVTKDGALSLEEFKTAMHLVVLRRNNISLPDTLPSSLVPVIPPPAPAPPPPPPAAAAAAAQITATGEKREKPGSEESLTSTSPSQMDQGSPQKGKDVSKWTKFVDSPTSSVSSPGPKPVNFDFHRSAVEQDPKILHPVALRLTPESQSVVGGGEESSEPCRSPRPTHEQDPTIVPPDIRPIQRPQPKKPAPGPGAIPPPPPAQVIPTSAPPSDDAAVPSPSGYHLSGPTSLPMGLKKDPPPPPPPRPYRTHARSSSLDLNRLDAVAGKNSGLLGAPPVVPPRVSPSTMSPKRLTGQHSEGSDATDPLHQGFADFAQFDAQPDSDPTPRRHGAFEVYRKPTPKSALSIAPDGLPESHDDAAVLKVSRQSTEEAVSLLRLQERNATLVRLCQQLSLELVEIQSEKAELEIQLEQLRDALPH